MFESLRLLCLFLLLSCNALFGTVSAFPGFPTFDARAGPGPVPTFTSVPAHLGNSSAPAASQSRQPAATLSDGLQTSSPPGLTSPVLLSTVPAGTLPGQSIITQTDTAHSTAEQRSSLVPESKPPQTNPENGGNPTQTAIAPGQATSFMSLPTTGPGIASQDGSGLVTIVGPGGVQVVPTQTPAGVGIETVLGAGGVPTVVPVQSQQGGSGSGGVQTIIGPNGIPTVVPVQSQGGGGSGGLQTIVGPNGFQTVIPAQPQAGGGVQTIVGPNGFETVVPVQTQDGGVGLGIETIIGPGGIPTTVPVLTQEAPDGGPESIAVSTLASGQTISYLVPVPSQTGPSASNTPKSSPTASHSPAPTIPTTGSPPYNTDLSTASRVGIAIGTAVPAVALLAWATAWCVRQRKAQAAGQPRDGASREDLLHSTFASPNTAFSSTPSEGTWTPGGFNGTMSPAMSQVGIQPIGSHIPPMLDKGTANAGRAGYFERPPRFAV